MNTDDIKRLYADHKKLFISISASAVVLIACTFTAAIIMNNNTHKKIEVPRFESPEQARQFFESELFREMSRDERRRIGRQVFTQMIDERAETFRTLPEEQRTEYLDSVIDQMQQMREKRRRRRAEAVQEERPNGPDDGREPRERQGRDGRRRGGPMRNPERFRSRIENAEPEKRAAREEFFTSLMKRMQERGIER